VIDKEHFIEHKKQQETSLLTEHIVENKVNINSLHTAEKVKYNIQRII
jgi:hypothetical protein